MEDMFLESGLAADADVSADVQQEAWYDLRRGRRECLLGIITDGDLRRQMERQADILR
jgi:hypothetical protein